MELSLPQILDQYQTFPEYLDGRYFNRVMNTVDRLRTVQEPLIIRFDEEGVVRTNEEFFMKLYHRRDNVMYVRIIVEKTKGDQITMRHSQLLIVEDDALTHFEPDESFVPDPAHTKVNQIVKELFPNREFKGKVLTLDQTEPKVPGGYCVAHVIKYAFYHAQGMGIEASGLDDIRKFALAVRDLYGPLDNFGVDIEFGPNDQMTGTLIGGLAGAGLGYAVGGVGGGLLGAAGGALAGNLLTRR